MRYISCYALIGCILLHQLQPRDMIAPITRGVLNISNLCKITRHNMAASVPISNLVCIKEVAIRTTFSHME